jgi:hypothetical protein
MAKDAKVQMPLWTCCFCGIIIKTYGKFIANEKNAFLPIMEPKG